MKAIYSRRQRIDASMCDFSGRIAVNSTFALFQDVASEHAEGLGVGYQDMTRRGSFWLTVRTRVHFYSRPGLMQLVDVSTWPAVPGNTRCDRFYRMTAGDKTLIEGRTEWCVFDIQKNAVRPMAEAGFREDMEYVDDTALEGPYARFRHDFTDAEIACNYIVRPSDVDVGQHMNNVAYLRMLMDSFSVAEQRAMKPREMEILFCMPCFETEKLEIMRRKSENSYEFGVRRPDGRYAALARLICE